VLEHFHVRKKEANASFGENPDSKLLPNFASLPLEG
jgi:hypothetical protein